LRAMMDTNSTASESESEERYRVLEKNLE
jgi:hypothetical protein